MENRRTGCKSQVIIALICLIILIPAAIVGGNVLARNDPTTWGFLLGLAAGLSLLIAAVFGSLYGAWMVRTGANITQDAMKWRSASDKAVASFARGAVQAMGEQRSELPPAQGWGYGPSFPMIEAAPTSAPEDDGFVA